MKVIGAVGQNGSGKDEVLKYLRDRYGVPFISTGDVVRGIALDEGIDPTRDNLREISERYFRQFGQGYFVRLLAERISRGGAAVTGISGIRSLNDVNILRGIFGRDFVLVNVFVSDPHLRYTRVSRRGEARDPHSYEEFLRQDAAEEEVFHVQAAAEMADHSIGNDGTLDDLHREVDRLVAEKGLLPDT